MKKAKIRKFLTFDAAVYHRVFEYQEIVKHPTNDKYFAIKKKGTDKYLSKDGFYEDECD